MCISPIYVYVYVYVWSILPYYSYIEKVVHLFYKGPKGPCHKGFRLNKWLIQPVNNPRNNYRGLLLYTRCLP